MRTAIKKEDYERIERPGDGLWRLAIEAPPARVEASLQELAEAWGARLEGNELEMPVLAGLRSGAMTLRWAAAAARGGTVVSLEQVAADYRLDKVSTAFLVFAALAGLSLLVLPFIPKLWSAIPALLVILVSAWLFIVARLKTSGPEDFLLDLKKTTEASDPNDPNS